MPTPTTYASDLTFVGIAKEATQGTAVAPTFTLIVNKEPDVKDTVNYLDDVGKRQAMAEVYAGVPGTRVSDVGLDFDLRPDVLPLFLGNILGDRTTTGTGPYVHAVSLQNAAPAQNASLTVTDWQGVTASTGARQYPGFMMSSLDFAIDPDKLVTAAVKGTAWGSSADASTPAVSASSVLPTAGYICGVGIGGPASGGTLFNNVVSASVSIARKVQAYPSLQGSQQPYIIRQGTLGVTGKLTFLAADETPLTNYLTNVQPQLQFLLNAGTTNIVQIDMQQVYYKTSAINRGKEAVEFDVDFVAVANTTNVGASGGFSPVKVTVTNSNSGTNY